VAGNGRLGNGPHELNYPQGIFIHDKTKRLYVADTMNDRIQVFPLDRSTITGLTVVSNRQAYYKIYVDEDDDDFPTIYIAVNSADRVEKWVKGATSGIQIGDRCRFCSGVWLDKDKNVYMSNHDRHCILQWSPLTNMTTTVAGECGMSGTRPDYLNEPQGIVVDKTTGALYVADLLNHRIQKWPKHALEGVTVAGVGDGHFGSDNASLQRPYGLRVDEETKIVYVVDLMNNRIQRWPHGETEGDTIAGGNGTSFHES
jgi:DNA-binding beta-propeller fold protein YncE